MYRVCIDYILCQISGHSFRKWLSYSPKALKMSICKFSNSFFFLQKYATQKDENNTIELPVEFCIESMFLVAKITALKFSPLFTGISQIQVLNFKLTLTLNLTYLQKKNKHSSEPSRSGFRLPSSVYFYGPSFFS